MSADNLAHKQDLTVESLRDLLPETAKDIRLNLSAVLRESPETGLSQAQVYGIALASAFATRRADVIAAVSNTAAHALSAEEKAAARAAATIMAMNNVYYRFIHLAHDPELAALPAGLRMNVIGSPGIDKTTFELYSLAVSAINGCGMCMESHARAITGGGIGKQGVQHCVKIAAVINAAAQALSA